VLIAGANQHGIAVAQQLNSSKRHGRRVVGFLDDFQRVGASVLPGVMVIGPPGDVLNCARETGADEIIIIAGALTWESQRVVAELVTRPEARLDARISPTFYDLLTSSTELSHIAYVPMITLEGTRLTRINAVAKATFDLTVAGILLALFSPLVLFWRIRSWRRFVPWLKRDSVLGVGGAPCGIWSLDPGLSKSAILRRIPSLWNVLAGDVSLVGPRPVRLTESEMYEPWLPNLYTMRPGLTGLWRLSERVPDIEASVALDLYYIRNYALGLDLHILGASLWRIVRRALGARVELARWVGPAEESSKGPLVEVVLRAADESGASRKIEVNRE
jgi:lipopolysaccharide/colanic/teichoic acid biosynthesis glycosyltransferase